MSFMMELTRFRLYDTMKFDALHNRQFLEWVFTPSRAILEEEFGIIIGGSNKDGNKQSNSNGDEQQQTSSSAKTSEESKNGDKNGVKDSDKDEPRKRKLFRRTSWRNSLRGANKMAPPEEYFNLCKGDSQTKAKTDARFEPLRELYQLAKVLFDFICPQEYGISDSEKVIERTLSSTSRIQLQVGIVLTRAYSSSKSVSSLLSLFCEKSFRG